MENQRSSVLKKKGIPREKLLAIEGLDGSGKATQAKELTAALKAQGVPVRQVSFPDYESDSSVLIKMYLSGQFGTAPNAVNAYAASSFFAVDRYASFQKDWRRDYAQGLIVADRYTTSNAIHQCSKLPEAEWDGFLDWLFDYEYGKLGIPAPSLVIYLKVDPEVSQKLMTGRYAGDESKKDIHERDLDYLKRSHQAADFCSKKLGWTVIDCCADGNMRSIEEIRGEILNCLSHL